ncbi:DUF6615 family protein [Rhodococcus koreensis]
MTRNSLQRLLDEISVNTWLKLVAAREHETSLNEESITENNFADVHSWTQGLHVHQFNTTKERAAGADWEWWVGSDSSDWIKFRIQAKRVYETKYEQLIHRGDFDGERQYDTLIRTSLGDEGVHPVHVFYNGWDSKRFPNREDEDALRGNHHFYGFGCRKELWGCAALSSFVVRDLHRTHKTSYAPDYLRHAIPWSKLFDFLAEGASPGISVDGQLSLIEDTIKYQQWNSGIETNDPDYIAYWRSASERIRNLPIYVRYIRDVRSAGPMEKNPNLGEFLSRFEPPAKIVIVTDLAELEYW